MSQQKAKFMTIQLNQNETLSEIAERFLAEAHVLLGANILTTEEVGIVMTAAVKPYWELYNAMSYVLDRNASLIQIVNALRGLSTTNSTPNVAQKPSVVPAPSFSEYWAQGLGYQPLERNHRSYESVDPFHLMYASPFGPRPWNLTSNSGPGPSSPNYIRAPFMNTCFHCGQRGNYAANCPSKLQVYAMPTMKTEQGKAGVE